MKQKLVEGLMTEGKPLKVALEAVGMAKSSYYYRPVRKRKPRALDEALVRAINEIRQGYAVVYGYRKVTMALRAARWTVNGKKVLRHLRALGLTQPKKLKGHKWRKYTATNTTTWLKLQPNGKAIGVGTVMIDYIKHCGIKARGIMLR